MTININELPPAQLDTDEWCTDCKEYDTDKHSCPRFNRVIRSALQDAEPKWIPVSERLPKVKTDVLISFEKNTAVGYYSRGSWNVNTGNGFYTGLTESEDQPIAWMPLPKIYKAGESE